jgi:hypothetical protein
MLRTELLAFSFKLLALSLAADSRRSATKLEAKGLTLKAEILFHEKEKPPSRAGARTDAKRGFPENENDQRT